MNRLMNRTLQNAPVMIHSAIRSAVGQTVYAISRGFLNENPDFREKIHLAAGEERECAVNVERMPINFRWSEKREGLKEKRPRCPQSASDERQLAAKCGFLCEPFNVFETQMQHSTEFQIERNLYPAIDDDLDDDLDAHKTTCKERLIKQLADELAGGVNFLAEPLLLNTHSPHADHSVYKHNNDGSDNYYLMIHRNRVNWLRFREVEINFLVSRFHAAHDNAKNHWKPLFTIKLSKRRGHAREEQESSSNARLKRTRSIPNGHFVAGETNDLLR
ncbi:hypothetical protein L1887_58540 [Cichorium endivia]|nr:hypothetical protein L1887_58540 [Cichorium endivia]